MGAGVLSIVFQPFSPTPSSGKWLIYGILIAFGLMFPERLIYLYFLFPVKVKYFVAVWAAWPFFPHSRPLVAPLLTWPIWEGWCLPFST